MAMVKGYFKPNSTIYFKKRLMNQVRALNQTTQNYRKFNQFQSVNIAFCSNAFKVLAAKDLPLQGKQLHSPMIKLGYCSTLLLQNQLLSSYLKCGESSDACKLFDEIPVRNLMTWNTLIRDSHVGLCYFRRMLSEGVNPDRITFLNLISLSSQVGSIEMGRQFHCRTVKSGFCKDCHVNSSLVNFYAKFGFVSEARLVFDDAVDKDLVLWNVMVSCYALNGSREEGFRVFTMMRLEGVKGDDFTYTSLVNCCASLAYCDLGKQIHGLVFRYGLDGDMVLASALTDMYAKNKNIIDARHVFDEMSLRNLISWNTMIVGYGHHNNGKEAWKLFTNMLRDDFNPDELTLASVISSCGNLSLTTEIHQLHPYSLKTGFLSFLSVSNSLLNAYSKSGNIACSFKLFSSIAKPDLVSYTCMIQSYAFHGFSRNAIKLFKKMVSLGVPKPDKITFLGVLSACSHGGLVTEGLHYFESMTKDHGIEPGLEHYTCLIDLLGRAGLVTQAFNVLGSMPMAPGPDTLAAFIGHCRVHNDLELAKWASEKLLVLEPDKNVGYAVLSNIFAYCGRWFDVGEIRKKMRDNCCLKVPGFSWLEVGGEIHGFVSRDEAHPRCFELYRVLGLLYSSMAMDLIKKKPRT
ncbi:pentatricopeptide repeat-containing protein At2g46050, mitochondrial [Lactuca sativa]|uniref:pentatricopeptide repeat-containing protein At2g46050, mitochondrial n=1 Tax=Lactuca sativa TaxID=4236 RepID=UPI000CD9B851|nr:pentatricopeptide repeat-containing protein At2g46050, mitochondrial [Lactuca sativa]